MSTTRTLKDKLMSASEVTSLASTDSLAVIDTAGDVKKIKPFGSINKKISFIEATGGLSVKILIADLGPYPVETGFDLFGFCGLCFKQNAGQINNGLGMAVVNAVCCYQVSNVGVKLDTTQANIMPSVVKYNGRVYIAISVRGNSGNVHLIGYGYNLLDSPIIIGSKNGTPSDTSEELFSGLVIGGGGVNHYRSINYTILQKGGLRNERNERTYQRPPEVEDDGRNGVPRVLLYTGERNFAWILYSGCRHYIYCPRTSVRVEYIYSRSAKKKFRSYSALDKNRWRLDGDTRVPSRHMDTIQETCIFHVASKRRAAA